MDLQQRINAAGTHAVETNRADGPRTWRREMAEAAGCSYQNISQAAKGGQSKMSAEMLKKIAAWAGVNEDWMVFGIGQMADTSNTQRSASDFAPYTVNSYSDTKLVRAPVVVWARLGTDLYKGNEELAHGESAPFETAKKHGDRCKFVVVNDNSLAPRVLPGDKLLLDPDNKNPKSDEIALFELIDGSFKLLRYRPIVGGFEAYDTTDRVYDESRHGIKIAATFVLMLRENV